MASAASAHFLSTSAHVAEIKGSLAPIDHKMQLTTYNGLRPLNKLNMLQTKSCPTAFVKHLRTRSPRTQNNRSSCSPKITCGLGMKLVFVSAEVAPWSKTGGLGDVLGGLPPAMAVRLVFHSL